jgi:cytochrome c5
MYSLVIGIIALVLFALYLVAMKMSDATQSIYTQDGEEYQAALLERIRPVGEVYLSGEEQAGTGPTVETAVEPPPVAAAMSGPQVYNSACIACHGTGVGGAPVVGDAAIWTDRIAQGNAVLKEHAVSGFTGASGFMPAKGGRADLSDAEIEAAVDYMVGESS